MFNNLEDDLETLTDGFKARFGKVDVVSELIEVHRAFAFGARPPKLYPSTVHRIPGYWRYA